jgi:hypothetical protein
MGIGSPYVHASMPAKVTQFSSRSSASLASSAGNDISMRNSCGVTSCGVPNVVTVLNNRNTSSPVSSSSSTVGASGASSIPGMNAAGAPGNSSRYKLLDGEPG